MKRILPLFLCVFLLLCGCTQKTVTSDFETDLNTTQQKEFLDCFDNLDLTNAFTYYGTGAHTYYFSFIDFYIHDGNQTTQIGLRPELGFVKYENQVYVVNPFHKIFDITRELQMANGIPVYGLLDNPNIEICKFCFEELYRGEEPEEEYDFDYDVWYCRGSAKVSDVMAVVGETDDNPVTLTEMFINEIKQKEVAINETIEYRGYQIKCVSNISTQGLEYGFLISK